MQDPVAWKAKRVLVRKARKARKAALQNEEILYLREAGFTPEQIRSKMPTIRLSRIEEVVFVERLSQLTQTW
jgi:hypothetical protein